MLWVLGDTATSGERPWLPHHLHGWSGQPWACSQQACWKSWAWEVQPPRRVQLQQQDEALTASGNCRAGCRCDSGGCSASTKVLVIGGATISGKLSELT